jgi:hypothetical protein
MPRILKPVGSCISSGRSILIGLAAVLSLAAFSVSAQSTQVFRWVDEKGKVHYGSSVPEQYREKGRKLDSENPDVLEARRKDAEARNAKDKAAVDAQNKSQVSNPDAVKPAATPAPNPTQASANPGCAEQWRQYMASIECFAPFVRGNGTVMEEGFQKCTTVKQPHECPAPPGISNR